MKRKKIWLKLGVLVSIVSISVSAVPYQKQVYAESAYVRMQESKQQKISAEEYNRIALEFISYLNPNDFKTWDQSLGTMTEKEAQEIKTFLDTTIIKDEKNDYQKAKKIYEWIVKNIRYASPQDQNVGLRPYDVFKNKVAVCGGYSNLYKAMLNLAGIPAVLVTGDTSAGGHAWNLVYADGKWFFSDSTWGSSDAKNFDYGVEQFSKSHTTTDVQGVSAKGENDTIIGFHKGIAVVGVEKGVKTVTVPQKFKELDVVSVAQSVFDFSSGIEQVVLTEKVSNIEVQSQPETLKSITVAEENPYFASKDGVLFEKDLSKILVYPYQKESKNFVMPKEVEEYDEKETFKTPYLSEILVEDGNQKFSSYDGAIYNVEKTRLLTIPKAKEKIYVAGTVELDNIALNGKQNLKQIVLEEGIEKIPAYAFNSCSGLVKLHIPASVKEISAEALMGVNTVGLTIYGESGSAAETFAKGHQIRFKDVKQIEVKLQETKDMIAKAKTYDNVDVYTKESIETLRQAIQEAEKAVNKEDVTVEELDEVIKNLDTAITGMQELEKPEKPEISEELAAKLQETKDVLTKAKKYDDANVYTKESIETLRQVIREAERTVNKEDVTIKELDKVIENLNKAISDMKKQEDAQEPEVEKPEVQKPSKEEKPQQNVSREEQAEVPKTADTFPIGIAGLGTLLSVAVITFLYRKRR